MTITKIVSVSALKAIFASACIGPQTDLAKSVPHVRSSKLTAEQTAILSEYAVENVEQCWVDPNVEGMLEELLGLTIAGPEDIVFLTIGQESFAAKRNQENRKRTLSRIRPITKEGTYSNLMKRGLWASLPTDSYTWDWNGQIQTAQHRLDGMLEARKNGAKLPFIHCTFGNPPQFRDLMDKAKAASKTDDSFKDRSLFPRAQVALVQLHETGVVTELQSTEDERKKLIDLRNKATANIANRLVGKDISKTGDKGWTWDKECDLVERFGTVSVDEFERKVTDPTTGVETIDSVVAGETLNALDYLVIRVMEAAKSQNGKMTMPWTEQFSPSIVITGLVMASNDETFIKDSLASMVSREPGETIEDFSDREIAAQSSLLSPESDLRIDWELVTRILHMLRTSLPGGGELGNIFSHLVESKNSKDKKDDAKYLYSPLSIAAMSAFVQLVKNIRDNNFESNVFTTYRKVGGEYSSAYRCFGGRDIGYQVVKKGKAAKE